MQFTNPSLLWESFNYCLLISFAFGSIVGGIVAQEKLRNKVNNLLIFRTIIVWGGLSLPFGLIWGWSYISAIYRLDCQQGQITLWRCLSNTPIIVDINDLTDVRLGMTSSRGDSWTVNFYINQGTENILYTTPSISRAEAKNFIDHIALMKRDQCSTM
ncbi:hypothetical protein [Methylobacter sp. YRD-M1]|uniref:hypothetical protein n=1 Tax=Methylobacter sp. YRD-M1 TaxID=2911520 RepID=UPI00227C8489|nr:hypothetical protein [Methylobacter sp. YRD-M1]WAK03307.1 hypothetical protein LZ558_05870 [Methylobacter sp. YRD-M1]